MTSKRPTDTERLNWLEKYEAEIDLCAGWRVCRSWVFEGTQCELDIRADRLRVAIDTAMQQDMRGRNVNIFLKSSKLKPK